MKNKGGRPKAEIDQTTFEKLCGLQCTLIEISGWFGVSEDTIENWCKSTYKKGFSEVFQAKRSSGLISLRRNQWKQSETNPTMAIFLGKQYLGQVDRVESKTTIESDGFIEALKGEISDVFKNGGGIVEE